MLTLTDVHLLVGMLSLITNPESVEVELGSRVLDAASGTKRDVDITVTARHPNGTVAAYAAVEVKDEAEPLGTPTVEQLIAKLRDMPQTRARRCSRLRAVAWCGSSRRLTRRIAGEEAYADVE
jgi:hypothetical protein